MGVTVPRKKKRNLLLVFLYRASKFPFTSNTKKLKLFLNLEWIFEWLAHEYSFKVYSLDEHPIRRFTTTYLFKFIRPEDRILDLGSNTGDLSYLLAEKAKYVAGVEQNKELIAVAKKNRKKNNLEFFHDDAYQFLQKNTEKFDVLILSHIIEDIDDPKGFLNKFRHFFNYIYIESPDFDKNHLNHYRKDLQLPLIYTAPDHIVEFDRLELIQLLNECNIEIVDSEYIFGIQRLWCKAVK